MGLISQRDPHFGANGYETNENFLEPALPPEPVDVDDSNLSVSALPAC
jgi:hypothetical protein